MREDRIPRTCGDCREYHELRSWNEKGDQDNCSPRGTRWHLKLPADHAACRTPHAVTCAPEDRQQAMPL